jgi:hypothetical protein
MHKVIEIITTYNEMRDSSIKTMDNNEIYNYYGRILILTIKDGTKNDDKTILDINNFTLIEFPIDIIKNTFIKNELRIIKYDYLRKYFNIEKNRNINVEQTELVLNMIYFNNKSVNTLLLKFNGLCNFNDYLTLSGLNNFLNYDIQTEKNEINTINMIKSLNEIQFWTLKKNCNLNITDKFIERNFNIKVCDRIKDDNIKQILNKMSDNIETEFYLNFIYRKELYVDASLSINSVNYKIDINKNKKLYETITIDIFNKIIKENKLIDNEKIINKEFYYLVMNLIASKSLCHYIINNQEMLEYFNNDNIFYKRYIYLFAYLLKYVWLSFYLEESIKKRNIINTDRFIFDIKTANLLPTIPCKNITDSPYLPFLVSKKVYNIDKNILGVLPDYNEYTKYGVTNLNTFKKRLNYFISYKSIDYLENINWNNIAISGSIMACCLPQCNPLMFNFMTKKEIDEPTENFNKYIREYYRDADIDILCNLNGHEFIDKVYHIYITLKNNMIKDNIIFDKQNILELKPITSVAIMININFIKEYLVNEKYSFNDIIININDLEIKKMIYPYYLQYKNSINNNHENNNNNDDNDENNNEINELYKLENERVTYETLNIVLNNDNNNEINKDNFIPIKINNNNDNNNDNKIIFIVNENLKFKIISSLFNHGGFEIFKIKNKDFFSTISSFHLPIVRAYYDGTTVKMTPSCISACHTMINIDYKYFAGSRDPIEIINKYRCRGYGIILNDKEKMRFIEYNNLVEKWKKIYKINISNPNTILNVLGHKKRNDNIFRLSNNLLNHEIKFHEYNAIIENDNNVIYNKLYNCNNNININLVNIIKNLQCINDYGYIEPLQLWLIDAFFNL